MHELDPVDELLGSDVTLVDIVDHLLTKGVVLAADVVLGVADVELVTLRLLAVLGASDKVDRQGPRGR